LRTLQVESVRKSGRVYYSECELLMLVNPPLVSTEPQLMSKSNVQRSLLLK